MKQAFPRLLVATEFPPNASGGGPAVVRQMLRAWPSDRLFWWSCRPDTARKFGCRVARDYVANIPPRLYPHFTFSQGKAWLLDRFWSPFAARNLEAALRDCRADAIWAVPHQWAIPPLARVLAHGRRPYHLSLHDSPEAHYPERRLGLRTAHRWISSTHDLYARATSRDVISKEMAEDWLAKTGTMADVIVHAGLEADDFAYLSERVPQRSGSIRIAYAGTIVAEQSFLLFIESLEKVSSQLPRPIELHFFGAHTYRTRPWFRSSWMHEHGDLNAEELKSCLRRFDWGFAPMELTDVNPNYNRYSLPTKVVSYLSAGLAVISLGHSVSTIANLARRYDFGIAVDERSSANLNAILLEGLSVAKPWARYGNELDRCARSEFDASKMRATLWTQLGVQD
jgi:hypothetical protein